MTSMPVGSDIRCTNVDFFALDGLTSLENISERGVLSPESMKPKTVECFEVCLCSITTGLLQTKQI